ncbi:hypothetical protein JZ751_003957, partial [Albula glossodonta]
MIKFCISKGAKIDQKQVDKSTALHFACTQGAIEAVKLMISAYSTVEDIINIPDGANQTPLHKAQILTALTVKVIPHCYWLQAVDHGELWNFYYQKLDSVRELLSDEDSDGCTPLHYACRLGSPESVQNMLGLRVCPSRKSKDKKSALHFAA